MGGPEVPWGTLGWLLVIIVVPLILILLIYIDAGLPPAKAGITLAGFGLISVMMIGLFWLLSRQVTYCEKCDELSDYSEYPYCSNCGQKAKNVWPFGTAVSQVRRKKELEREHIISEFKRNLEQWQSEGYDVPKLKRVLEMKNVEQMEREFRETEQKIRRLKAAKITLNKLVQDVPQEDTEFGVQIESIRKKLKDPSKADEVEGEVRDFAVEVSEYSRLKDEVLGMIENALKGKGETRIKRGLRTSLDRALERAEEGGNKM